MKKIALVGLFALGAAASVAAQGSAGNWKVVGDIGGNKIDLTCALTEADKKLAGVCKDAMFPKLDVKGTVDGKTAKWSYEVDFQGQKMTVDYTGTAESATSYKGDISVMGQASGTFVATKQP